MPRAARSVTRLAENQELAATSNSNSAFVEWPQCTTRYLKVCVNDSYQQRYPGPWMSESQLHWCRKVGLPTAGDGRNLNTQIAEITCFDARPADFPVKNPPDVALPRHRLERDWLYQDAGLDIAHVFTSSHGAEKEQAMVQSVLECVPPGDSSVSSMSQRLDQLVRERVAACDPRWRSLYFEACAARRKTRLQALRERAAQFIYVKHGIFGCMQGLAGKYDIPDEQVRDYTFGFKQGGQLCLGTVLEDGTLQHEVLLEKPAGAICYPTLSSDAGTLSLFHARDFETDSYYLYAMDMATRRVRQITFPIVQDGRPLPVADCEPAFLPDGRIVFTSTRDVHISDCWYRAGGNIYCCNSDGGNIRRLTFDQLMSNNPEVLGDGRIVFTRWEYNDRNALFAHPLICMNPDGTAQTAYYGNYSMFPAAIIHAHGIPGSPKALAVIAGHHSIYKGKLGLIDRTHGLWAGNGIEFVHTKLNGDAGRESADFIQPEPPDPSKPHLDLKIDVFGQFGPQYAHPYAFDEENYLCSFCPEGYLPPFGPFNPPLGLYYMKPDGVRELLAFDDWQGTGQAIPVMARRRPPCARRSFARKTTTGSTPSRTCIKGRGWPASRAARPKSFVSSRWSTASPVWATARMAASARPGYARHRSRSIAAVGTSSMSSARSTSRRMAVAVSRYPPAPRSTSRCSTQKATRSNRCAVGRRSRTASISPASAAMRTSCRRDRGRQPPEIPRWRSPSRFRSSSPSRARSIR